MSGTELNDSDLEALVNSKIKSAIRAAVDKIGEKELSKVTGIAQSRLDLVLQSDDEYLPVKVVSVICHLNRSHGDPNLQHSSISECLKGTTVRLPTLKGPYSEKDEKQKRVLQLPKTREPVGPMYDQKSVKILNFGVSTLTILVLCYFLGGLVLAPLLSLQSCVGVSFSPAMASPCLGSVLGLVIGAFGSLGYTYYYFTKKL